MSAGAVPGDAPGTAGPDPQGAAELTEILARFARSAAADAPSGTIQLAGHGPVPFAGWLDLMARVEELLASDREGRVP